MLQLNRGPSKLLSRNQFKSILEALERVSSIVQSAIQAELFSIQHAIRENERAARELSNAETKTLEKIAAHLRELQTSDLDKSEAVFFRKQNYRMQKWVAIGTGLAALGAFIYAGETGSQLRTMNETYIQMRQQTSLMQQQVEAALAATFFTQPRVSWPEPHRAYISLILDNRGKVAATSIHGNIHIDKVSVLGRQSEVRSFPAWDFSVPDLNPSVGELPTIVGTFLPIDREELKGNGGGGAKGVKIAGTLTYFNGYRPRIEEICYFFFGPIEFRNKGGVIQQTNGETMITCSDLPALISDWRVTRDKVLSH